MILTIDAARELAEAAMVAAGHTKEESEIIADHLIDCELRGLSFGGLPRTLSIIERIRELSGPRRPITIVRETPLSATLDGADNVGYLVGSRATDIAIEKAKTSGMALVGANETWYTGMFSYYLERVTKAGLAGMIAGSAPPRVAPKGGTEGRFGTNPIAFGFPSTTIPIIWDIGTASIMSGEVTLANRLGEPLPEGSAFAPDGSPTRDAAAALKGAFTVWGGHKGSGLALTVQLLGMMAGAAAMPKGLRDCGFFILVFNPELLMSAEDYKQRVSDYADRLRSTRPEDPAKPVRVPFERSVATRARRIKEDSIEVPDKIFASLTKIIETAEGWH